MKTAVADTSVERYLALVEEGIVTRQQARILSKMQAGRDYTRSELAAITLLQINAVCGRVNELLHELHRLEEGGKRSCSITGNTVHTVKLASAVAFKDAA